MTGGGVTIPFKDGHTRQLPVLTGGPFRYVTYAATYLEGARKHTHIPLKQAVISASALSLLYPGNGIAGYPREAFLDDLVREAATDIERCLSAGATVQIDFTEGRLAVKLDPSKRLLEAFIDLNNRVLEHFSPVDRRRIGVHTCPGGDRDSTHSADVDYAELLPALFRLDVGSFFVQLASEPDRARVLRMLGTHATEGRRIFVGVTDPINPRVESPEEVRDQNPRGRQIHRSEPARFHRRLRLFALQRRHVHVTRYRVCQGPSSGGRHRTGFSDAGNLERFANA